MLSLLCQTIKHASVVRRLEFVASFYTRSMPNYWKRLAFFSVRTKNRGRNSITHEQVWKFIENIPVVNSGVLLTDVN